MKAYPKMLYRGGTDAADSRIVDDEAALEAAAADGYLPLDMAAMKRGAAPAVEAAVPAAEPIDVIPVATAAAFKRAAPAPVHKHGHKK